MLSIITFQKKTIRVSNYYKCACGHRFTRRLSDWYTMSPLNPMSEAECRNSIAEKLMKETRRCPKCKSVVDPV